MTIATLLEHVGIQVPRYVAVDGRIVFDQGAAPGTGHAPLALAPHRFHDGDDPSPERVEVGAAWWMVDARARANDEDQMRRYFPGFTLVGEDCDYTYEGTIDTGRGRFRVLVLPQIDGSLPSIVPLQRNLGRTTGRRFVRAPHLYRSGNLCLADATDWKPSVHTTATAVAWCAHWFAAYVDWRLTGRWPVDGFGASAA